jgi:hypothetical protein
MGLEYLGDRHLRRRLDLVVGIDEGAAQQRGDPLSDALLADPHHADEHDRAVNAARDGFYLAGRGLGIVMVHCSPAYSWARPQRKLAGK